MPDIFRDGNIPRIDLPPVPPLTVLGVPPRVLNRQALLNAAPRFSTPWPNYAQLTNFTAQMNSTHTFARPSRFRVEIQIANLFNQLDNTIGPPGYDQNWAKWYGDKDALETATRLMFYCHGGEIPGYSFQTDENRVYGPQFKVPYMPTYQDMDLEFFVGDDMFERWFFEGWMHSIMDPQTNDFNYIGEYSTSIDIYQMALDDQDQYVATLHEAYPIAINQMETNWENSDQIHKLSVTFTYKKVITLDVNLSDLSVNNDRGRDKRERFKDTVFLRPRTGTADGNNQNSPRAVP